MSVGPRKNITCNLKIKGRGQGQLLENDRYIVEVMLNVRSVKVIENSSRSNVEVKVNLRKLMPVCQARRECGTSST